MLHYILSRKTEEDIDEIYVFGSRKFGKDQALDYLIDFRVYFQFLFKNPNIGKQRNQNYSSPFVSHIIFCQVFKNHIRIIRVLHGSRDYINFLK